MLCIWQDIKHSSFKHETGHWQWQTRLATSQFGSSNSSSELSVIVTRCQVPLSLAVGHQAPKEIITWNSPTQCVFSICWDELTPKKIPSAFLLTVNISIVFSWVSQKAANKENKFILSAAETWSLLFKRAEKHGNFYCVGFFWGRSWKVLVSQEVTVLYSGIIMPALNITGRQTVIFVSGVLQKVKSNAHKVSRAAVCVFCPKQTQCWYLEEDKQNISTSWGMLML